MVRSIVQVSAPAPSVESGLPDRGGRTPHQPEGIASLGPAAPSGKPSSRLKEPGFTGERLDMSLGLHLELLGRALQLHRSEATESSDLRASLELSSRDLLAELYPDFVAGVPRTPKPADLPPHLPVLFQSGEAGRDTTPTPQSANLQPRTLPVVMTGREVHTEHAEPGSCSSGTYAFLRDRDLEEPEVVVQNFESGANRSLHDAQSFTSGASRSLHEIDMTATKKVSILSGVKSRPMIDSGTSSLQLQGGARKDIKRALRRNNTDKQLLSALGTFMMSPKMEVFFSFLIAMNTLVMILEDQHKGAIIGHDLKFYNYYGSDAYNGSHMPNAMNVFKILEYVFFVMFTAEAILRMIGRGRQYWTDRVELFDLFVVFCSGLSLAVQEANAVNIAIFRILRLAKLLRIVQLIKMIEGFDSLHLMTIALASSLYALGWAVILLLAMQTLVALILTNVFRDSYLEDDQSFGEDEKLQLFEYFGTYARAMLSTFELTFANWPAICRFLTENCHEAWMLMVICYKLTFGFAIIGVLNAVFMQETFKVASTDDTIMVRAKLRQSNVHRHKMQRLFKAADRDKDGRVGLREFRRVLRDPSIQTWLASMDLDATDANLLYELIQKESKHDGITSDEMIKGVAKLKGVARSIDIQLVLRALKEQWAPESEQPPDGLQHPCFESESSRNQGRW